MSGLIPPIPAPGTRLGSAAGGEKYEGAGDGKDGGAGMPPPPWSISINSPPRPPPARGCVSHWSSRRLLERLAMRAAERFPEAAAAYEAGHRLYEASFHALRGPMHDASELPSAR